MRATEPGLSVGVALENLDGPANQPTGRVLCFVKVGEANLAAALQRLASENDRLARVSAEMKNELADLMQQMQKLAHNVAVKP